MCIYVVGLFCPPEIKINVHVDSKFLPTRYGVSYSNVRLS